MISFQNQACFERSLFQLATDIKVCFNNRLFLLILTAYIQFFIYFSLFLHQFTQKKFVHKK